MTTILATNDDGIESPGLRALVEAVLPLGKVIVVAPSNQKTSAGRSFVGARSEYFRQMDYQVNGTVLEAYHCECSPARIVLHAFDILFKDKKPDLLVSGINYGENLGTNVTISGTIGAALQAASYGVQGLTVSLQTEMEDHFNYPELDWSTVRHFARQFAALMLEREFPADVDILNVNVPAVATNNTQFKWTKLSRQSYFANHINDPTILSRIGDARCCYGFKKETLEPDSDILAFSQGLVTVTPMSMDLTSRVDINML
ncbi:MAG: 5'/3'-nucleotidase SurE [Kiritimatiellae bacterium]|nr:5'/3'-nucleotidase SurE [Kiritimatiellia bacterium]MDD5520639.1 5'/3'-nucleotidase SurE [Kiritimatiellia bacterium]